jgi:hypothetical protein
MDGGDPAVRSCDLTDWRELAACRDMGPAAFYDTAPKAARARCRRCPVDELCFWFALTTEEEAGCRFGIWGGTTPDVRAYIARVSGAGYARRRFLALLAANRQLLRRAT